MGLEHAYLLSILGLIPVYLILFWLRPDSRKKLGSLFLGGAVAGPISQYWYLQDYWHPVYTLGKFGFLEDALFAALVFGISGGVISLFFKTGSVEKTKTYRDWRKIFLAAVLLVSSVFLLTNLLGWNSIYASSVGFLLLIAVIWLERPDFIKISILGSLFWIIFIALYYNLLLSFWPTLIQDWWLWQNISGITFLRIPLEEFFWFGTWGLVGSVIYEWVRSLKLERRI